MKRQLSDLLWRILAPTVEQAREEGREEVRASVRDVLDWPHLDLDGDAVVPADAIRRALDN